MLQRLERKTYDWSVARVETTMEVNICLRQALLLNSVSEIVDQTFCSFKVLHHPGRLPHGLLNIIVANP